MSRITTTTFLLLLLWGAEQFAFALGFEEFGPAKQHQGVSADWPKGVIPLRKHGSRVYWQDVNGNDRSYFDGGIEEINELLQLFSEIDQRRHIVVVRSGRPSATSFQGNATPYAVEFHLPSGIYLFHARQNASSGVYATTPRLFLNLNRELLKDVSNLQVPDNVELHAHAYDTDLLLASAKSSDRMTRSQALRLLGEDGVRSEQATEALDAALASDDEAIVRAAKAAREMLDSADEAERQLRDEVHQFLQSHPRRYRVPSADEVWQAIQAVDAAYAKDGFTARGTLVQAGEPLRDWVVTMGDGKLVVRSTAVDPQATGVIENLMFASADHMGMVQRSRYWVDGELVESKPFLSQEPVGNTYDLLIGRFLWPMGMGFSRRIDRVEKVSARPDGTLDVVATGDDDRGVRWELTVDPFANYLVQQARSFRTWNPDGVAVTIVDAVGMLERDGRFANHTARWSDREGATPTSISVHSVSSQPDIDLILELQDRFAEDPPER